MQHSGVLPISSDPLPPRFLSRLAGFADLFTRPTWSNVLVLLAGVILAPGRRTVTTALRILGRDRDPDFCTFHRILNRAAWSSRAAAGRLLLLLVTAFVPSGAAVVIGIDDTIERRWGPKISARGIYRDPVRSSKGHFVKASGLRWLSAMLLVRVPWADHIMALPFLTLLAPSKRFYAGKSPVPIRWLLVRAPKGELQPQAFLASDLNVRPCDILAWFVSRWQVEVTFEETRAHLGVETQRQWSDKAILRTSPALLSLFSIVTLWAHDLSKSRKLKPRTAAWHPKAFLTFSDAIAAVRREIWGHQISFMSRPRRDSIEIPRRIWHRMQNALAHAA